MVQKSPKSTIVCIIGLGYVGYPLASAFSKHLKTIGYDIDEEKVNRINAEPGNRVIATTDPARIREPRRRPLIHPGNDLRDLLQCMVWIARIDPLGGVADEEVLPAGHHGGLLENRDHDLLGEARVDGRLEDDNRTILGCSDRQS